MVSVYDATLPHLSAVTRCVVRQALVRLALAAVAPWAQVGVAAVGRAERDRPRLGLGRVEQAGPLAGEALLVSCADGHVAGTSPT